MNARQTHIRRLMFTFPSGHLKLPKPACESAASVVVPLKYVWLYTAPAISTLCTVDVCGSIYLSIYLFIYIHVSGVLTMLSCLVSVQLMSVGMRVGDAACASKCTHKKQFRHQCSNAFTSIYYHFTAAYYQAQTALYG